MKRDTQQLDSPPPSTNDELDAWLARAEWPEPTAGSTERLRRQWCELRRRGWSLRLVSTVATAAAMVALVAGGAWWVLPPEDPVVVVTNVDVQPPQHAEHPSPGITTQERSSPGGAFAAASRPPTALELAIVAAMDRRAERSAPPSTTVVPNVDPIDEAIARVNEKGDGDVAAAMAGLRMAVRDDGLIVLRLRQAAHLRTTPDRVAAERLLVEVADVPTLTTSARRGGGDPSVRSAAMAALLRRPTHDALNAYLGLVADPPTRALAVRASDQVNDPPVDALFARFDDPRVDVRVAAALVLARINGPVVTQRLAARVERNVNRREALIALAASRGPEARAYLAHACEVDELSAAVRSAMVQRTAYQ